MVLAMWRKHFNKQVVGWHQDKTDCEDRASNGSTDVVYWETGTTCSRRTQEESDAGKRSLIDHLRIGFCRSIYPVHQLPLSAYIFLLSRGALFSQCPYKNAVRLAVVYTQRHYSSSSSFEIRSFLLTVNEDYPIKELAHLSHWQAININQSLNYSTQTLRICNHQYLNLKRIEFNFVHVKKVIGLQLPNNACLKKINKIRFASSHVFNSSHALVAWVHVPPLAPLPHFPF